MQPLPLTASRKGRGNEEFDVVIVGGGLVGASLALALAPLPLKIALVETHAVNLETPASWDERCIAINAASQRIFESLGVWAALNAEAQPILSTHISERGRFGVARFNAQDAGLPALGYNVPMRALGQTLWRALLETSVQMYCPASAQAIEISADGVRLRLAPENLSLQARLVVAADGAHSPMRQMLGIGARSRDYAQSAIVSAVRVQRSHHDCAYERFTPDGPIALLPKPHQQCSLVWTVPAARVQALLACDDAEFLTQVQHTFGERLGRFSGLGRRNAHPLSRVMSDQLTSPRLLFVGNAAQSLHPVAAQGFNLGLRDVASVAELLAAGGDPGAPERLQAYEQSRASDRKTVAGFTDHLIRLFSNRVPGLRGLRHLGLLALDLAPPLKQAVMWQNLGYSGTTPEMVRRNLDI